MREVMEGPWFETPPDRIRKLLSNDLIAHLERALDVVQRDIDATCQQLGKLQLRWIASDGEYLYTGGGELYVEVYVALGNGDFCGGGTNAYAGTSNTGRETFEEVVDSVIQSTQDCIMQVLLREWPVCPQHNRMLHLSPTAGCSIWNCQANGGHDLADVGGLAEINKNP